MHHKVWSIAGVLLLFSAPTMAQLAAAAADLTSRSDPSREPSAVSGRVEGKSMSAGNPMWNIIPRLGAEMVYTDNVAPASGKKENDWITKIAPGIHLWGKGGRVSGNLDYHWSHIMYANHGQLDNRQQALRAQGAAELVDDWLFVDANAHITQQPISAFGLQSTSNEIVTGNRTETSGWRISPHLKGVLANRLDYQLRYTHARADANSGAIASYGGTRSDTWSARLGGDTRLAMLTWSLDFYDQRTVLGNQAHRLQNRRLTANVDYRPDPQWRVLLGLGREEDNYSLLAWRRRTFSGYGLEWAPTERSLASWRKERHSYGDSHTASFSHRTAGSAWRIVETRQLSLPGQQLLQAPLSTAYELLEQQLRSQYPDPLARANAVQALLQQLGIAADTLLYGNVMTAQVFEQRRREVSFSFGGVNNTITFTLQRSISRRGGPVSGHVDDFATTDEIRQRGVSANWAHKLSPHTTFTLTGTTSRTSGEGMAGGGSQLHALSLLLSTRLGPHTTASAGLRRLSYDSTGGIDYDENALTGALLLTF